MEKSKIDRINALAKKSKSEGLTEQEKEEQQTLRQEYLSNFRKNLVNTLDQIVLVDPEGNRSKIGKKESKNLPQ